MSSSPGIAGTTGEAPVQHHETPRGERASFHVHGIRAGESGLADDDIDAFAGQYLRGLGVVDAADDGAYALHHRMQVDVGIECRQPEPACGAHRVRDARGLEQRLAGHASGPGAVAPNPGSLHQRDRQAQLAGEPSRCQPRRSGSDDNQVVVGLQAPVLRIVGRTLVQACHALTPQGGA